LTKLEHCQKCGKQIEFRDKKNPRQLDDEKSQMNQLESKEFDTASVFIHYFCNGCWSKLEYLLQEKGFLPRGINQGFNNLDD